MNAIRRHVMAGLLLLSGVFAVLIGLMMLFGNGDSPDVDALFADLMPGQPMPSSSACIYSTDYYYFTANKEWTYCPLNNARDICRGGSVSGTNGTITRLTLWGCHFTVGDVMKEHGRWIRVASFTTTRFLYWDSLHVVVRSQHVNPMTRVFSITWTE